MSLSGVSLRDGQRHRILEARTAEPVNTVSFGGLCREHFGEAVDKADGTSPRYHRRQAQRGREYIVG